MKDKIFSGIDRAKELGFGSYRDYLTALGVKYGHPWNGKTNDELSVTARVDFGRWIADCQCGAAQFVEPDQPFYCAECGMDYAGKQAIKVIFPQEKNEIEEELMQRETSKKPRGYQKTIQAPPKEPGLSRSWKPDEKVEDLKKQRNRKK